MESVGSAGFSRLEREIAAERAAVVGHSIYSSIRDVLSLRAFMNSHAFAVWDFMSLLKALQRHVTCVDVPWLPPADTVAARLVNEIVLGEESDEIAPGRYMSHHDLYLAAMTEVGADAWLVRDFIGSLREGFPLGPTLEGMPVPLSTRRFVLSTLAMCKRGPVEVAAAFLLGREQLVPAMFREIIAQLEREGTPCPSFRLYLERHVEVDTAQHGPLAQRLLVGLCGESEARWTLAAEAAREALVARRKLWDGVVEVMRAQTVKRPAR